ncbi:phage head morphogenesis protein [Riemerella anatipestifer]|uniref:Phage head morphogenesis domain-containing protein n=1 Tax=Riemerella anatipestifer TaxID=34085 RepID=A0A1S7DPE7_RIEAN|nr:minor capsid protein [Riemerella anatipestifer]AQY21003.1 hypothetical protein AB406_0037 [Riemerella anatipestifer]
MHLSHDSDQPDWADLLAKDWIDTIRGIYKDRSTPKDGYSTAIVKKTGKELSTAVDKGYIFKGVDYDTPDYIAREVLKQNVWKFSVAKNYNDCIRLNNLLLRPDGSIRPWHEFKREAMRIVGMSNRYLKTEYDTIVAGAMMSRKWQEIQRDKHIFPFVKFMVTMDDHTSEICSPLHGIVVSVDDPFLQQYFPPNHFNCRTDVIKLRNAEPTPQRLLPYIDIPTAFLNNVGATGEIFTEENRYITNTPDEVLEKSKLYSERFSKYEKLKSDENYYDVEFSDNAGLKAIHKEHHFDKKTGIYEKIVQDLFYKRGDFFTLESEASDVAGKKVDGFINIYTHDISTIIGIGKNTIKRALKHSVDKKAEVAILYYTEGTFDIELLKNSIKGVYGLTKHRFEYIYYIVNDKIYTIKKTI